MTLKRLILLGLCLSPTLSPAWGAACGERGDTLIELRVISNRGDAVDRIHSIRVDADGCVALRRPPAHRSPGVFSARLEPARLARLATQAADPALRALDPARALQAAQASLAQRSASRGLLQRSYISHPTQYVLRLGAGTAQRELRIESIFQHAELHPESAELAVLAELISEVLALDGLPEPAAEAQP